MKKNSLLKIESVGKQGRKELSLFLLATLFILFFYADSRADTVTWIGSTPVTKTDWDTATNWDTGSVPGQSDEIHFAKGSTVDYTDAFTNTNKVIIGYDSNYGSNPGTGAMTITGDATFNDLTIGITNRARKSEAVGTGTLTINGNLTVTGSFNAGQAGAATITVQKPDADTNVTVSLGTGSYSSDYAYTSSSKVNFSIPYGNTKSGYFTDQTVVDFSQASQVTIMAKEFNLAASQYGDEDASGFGFRQSAKVTLGTNADITANRVSLFCSRGASAGASASDTALPTELILGSGTTNFNVGLDSASYKGFNGITVGGRKASAFDSNGDPLYAQLIVADVADGQSKTAIVNIRGLQTGVDASNNPVYGTTDLKIAFNYKYNTGDTSYGKVDLSSAAQVNMNLRNLVLAYRSGTSSGRDGAGDGLLILGNNSTVTVSDYLIMSYKKNVTTSGGPGTSTAISNIYMDGANSSLTASKIIMGNVWGDDLNANKAVSKSSIFLSGGATLNSEYGAVVRGNGRIICSSSLSSPGAFSSTVSDTTGDVTLGALFVGYKPPASGETAEASVQSNFYAQGYNFTIGAGQDSSDNKNIFYVGAESETTATTLLNSRAYFGEADIADGTHSSGVTNLTINVNRVRVGDNANISGQVAKGNLYLAKNNTITAYDLIVSENDVAVTGAVSSIQLGEGTNDFNIGTVVIGGKNSAGVFSLNGSEGVFTLASTLTARTGAAFTLDGYGSVTVNGTEYSVPYANLAIAREDASTTGTVDTVAQVDLTNTSSAVLNLGVLDIAVGATQDEGVIAGQFNLGDNATVTAYEINMSRHNTTGALNTNFSGLILGDPNSTDSTGSKITIQAGTITTLNNSSDNTPEVTTATYAGNLNMGSDAVTTISHLHLYHNSEIDVANQITIKGQGFLDLHGNSVLTAKTADFGTSSVNSTTKVTIDHSTFTLGTAGTTIPTDPVLVINGDATCTVNGGKHIVYGDSLMGKENDSTSSITISVSNGGEYTSTGKLTVNGLANVTLNDTSSMKVDQLIGATGADTTTSDETSHLTLNGTSHLQTRNISVTADTTSTQAFKIDMTVKDNALLEVIDVDGAGTLSGADGVTLTVSGGRLIADKIDVPTGATTKGDIVFTGGTMSISQLGSSSSAGLGLTVHQQGTSVFSPGYASPTADNPSVSNYNVGDEVFKGMSKIYGNYILDSGTIKLDINTAIDRDNINVFGENGLASTVSGKFELGTGANAKINISTGEGFFTNVADGGYMTGYEVVTRDGNTFIEAVFSVPLLYSDQGFFLGDSLTAIALGEAGEADATAWGQAHIDWGEYFLSDEAIYDVLATSTISDDTTLPAYVLRAKLIRYVQEVPEPATWLLLILGCIGVYYLGQRRFRSNPAARRS